MRRPSASGEMPTSHRTVQFAATAAGFEQAFTEVRSALDDSHVHGRARYNVELVFEEIGSNIVRHGSGDHRPRHVDLSIAFEPTGIVLTFADDGPAFDPLQHPTPTLPTSLADAPTGGLGIFLVRKAATHVDYERTPDEKNQLTVTIANN